MRLDHRHVTAISALAQGCTQQQAAAEASVTSRTIRRWLDAPPFLGHPKTPDTITLDEARPWLDAIHEHPEDMDYVISWTDGKSVRRAG